MVASLLHATPAEAVEKSLYGPQGTVTQGAGVAVPKAWFSDPFAILDSLGLGYKASPSGLSYETLKQMSERNEIVAAVIQTRTSQVASFCRPQRNKYSIGFKISHRNPDHRRLSQSDLDQIRYIENFVLNCGAEYSDDHDDLETFVKKSVRDRLIFDQVASETTYKYSGKPHAFYAVPGMTIRLASPKKQRGTPMSSEEAKTGIKYVQIIDGAIANTFSPREMTMSVANPRTDIRAWGYGLSELELLIRTVTAHLFATEWNMKMFTQGSTTKGILNLRGNIPPQQLENFKRMWLAQVSGVSNAWRSPIINSNEEIQWINLQPNNSDMGYESWMNYLIKVVCAIYLIDPAEINFDLRSGQGQKPMFMSTNEAQQKVSQDRGLRPLLRHIEKHLNRAVVWRINPEYSFEFVGVDAKTEAEAIDLRLKELQSYMTLNEVREREQLPPVKHGDIVPNPSYIGYRNQKEMMAAQQGGAGGPGGAGAPTPADDSDGRPEKDARHALARELGDKEHGGSGSEPAHRPDRYAPLDDDWEETYNAATTNDLKKATEPLDALISDFDRW